MAPSPTGTITSPAKAYSWIRDKVQASPRGLPFVFFAKGRLGFDFHARANSTNRYKFTSKERDPESGLDNFGARFDSSVLGRFMSPDPGNIGVTRANPQTWNAYSYVLNNPLNSVDPTGLDCIYIDNDTGKQTGFNRGDCDNSTEEKANSGYYVNGTVDRSSIQTEGNWVTYTFKPEDSPLNMVGAQCTGECPNEATLVLGASGSNVPTIGPPAISSPTWKIGPDNNWFHSLQFTCIGPGLKEFPGGLVLKNDIEAAAGAILGDSNNVNGPVGAATATVGAEKALDAAAESKTAARAVQSALREEGHRVSQAAIKRGARFGGRLALVAHVAFAANDGREAYNACSE